MTSAFSLSRLERGSGLSGLGRALSLPPFAESSLAEKVGAGNFRTGGLTQRWGYFYLLQANHVGLVFVDNSLQLVKAGSKAVDVEANYFHLFLYLS